MFRVYKMSKIEFCSKFAYFQKTKSVFSAGKFARRQPTTATAAGRRNQQQQTFMELRLGLPVVRAKEGKRAKGNIS
jgi:hypothetical protein